MNDIYQRQAVGYRNELKTSCAALVGLVEGVMTDEHLSDTEIRFLGDWLKGATTVSEMWPGSLIADQVREILADGVVTTDERGRLVETLRQLVGGRLDEVAEAGYVSELPLDRVESVEMPGKVFCFTGEFVFGPRGLCEQAIQSRGGLVGGITKKLNYLVVGGLGSPEWKHGSFGTKIEKAVQYRTGGLPLRIVHEDVWAGSLRG